MFKREFALNDIMAMVLTSVFKTLYTEKQEPFQQLLSEIKAFWAILLCFFVSVCKEPKI